MTKSRIDLVDEVLDLLGVSQTGQEPAAEDAEKVNDKIDTVLANLASRRIIYIQDADAIDDEYFDPLAKIVANNVGPKFGQAYSPDADMVQEKLLRTMQPQPGVRDTFRVEYF